MNRTRRWAAAAMTASVVIAMAVAAPVAASATGKPDRFIVAFEEGRTAAGVAAVAAAGGEIVLELGPQNAAAVELPASAVAALAAKGGIRYIEPDVKRYPLAYSDTVVPGDDTVPYGIQMVHADDIAVGADTITIGIIDSGLYTGHSDLGEVGTKGTGTGWSTDFCGHGTHVAGTIAADDDGSGVVGVYPGASLVITKVFGDDCSWSYASGLVAALNATVAAGADVINMSLGGSRASRTERSAMDQAYADGVLLVAAAGNDGNTRTSYPAGYDSVISVAAVDSDEQVADFSQQNGTVELAAPGVSVLSTVPFDSVATVSTTAGTFSGSAMEGSADDTASGVIVDGGLCAAPKTKGKPGSQTGPDWTGMVVVCERGDITFADKVKTVVANGGVAAVIYNNVSGSFSGTLGGTVDIPVLSLSDTQGQDLLTGGTGLEATVAVAVQKPASGHEAWDGTSMATPHVAGVAAKIWSHNADWTNVQIRDALTSTAKDLGASGRDTAYGYGLVQALAALNALP